MAASQKITREDQQPPGVPISTCLSHSNVGKEGDESINWGEAAESKNTGTAGWVGMAGL